MMRDSRRRSPQAESSRRRRREKERDRDRDPNRRSSRDQPTTTPAPTADTADYYKNNGTSDSYYRGITTEDRDRSASFAAERASTSKPWMGENPDYYNYTTEPDPIPHSSQQPQPRSQTRAHARAPSSSGSDTSSPSYLDISRRYDTSRFGGVFNTFFRAPSEHRRQQRRVKNKAKKRAVFPFSNSSSSSLNSDLAYGDGYIPQSRTSSRRSRSDGRQRNEPGDSFQPGKLQRRQTDEEIVAIGRQLSDLAKRQNDEDLRAAGRSRPSKIMSAAAGLTTLNELRRGKKNGTRGIGSSKPTGRNSDDEDWESATDDDSSDDDASALAYGGSRTNLPGIFGGAAAAAAGAGALWASQSGRRASGQQQQQQQHHRPGVDPSLFGPVNSLNGMVTPVPFRDEDRYNGTGYDRRREAPTVADSMADAPMRQVYPVSTSRPDQFDARHSASLPGSRADDLPKVARPGPAPIQAPVPIAPVSSKVYDAQSLEEAGRREERERRRARDDESRGISSAAKMSFGTAATAAVAAAALKSHHQRGRDEDYRSYAKVAPKRLHRGERTDTERRRSERELDLSRDAERDSRRERERERDRDRDRDREYRKSKDYSSKSKEDRDYKRSSRYDDLEDRTSKKSDNGKDRERRSYKRDGEEIKVEYDDDKTSRRPRREEKMPADSDVTKDIATGAIVAGGAALAAGALASGSSSQVPERPLTPAVFTVDREPTFDNWPPRSPSPDIRLSRKDSFEMEKMAEDGPRQAPRTGHEYEENTREAKSVYDEAKQATVPVGAAAVAAAVAAEKYRGRERRRDEYSDDGSRERSAPAKDPVQEEADRYYREAEAARKVAEEKARSRSRSKDRDRGSKEEEPEIAIVTPPGYEEDKKLEKSPYDAPNADVRIDNEIYPADTHRFRASGRDLDAPVFKSRDPSAERERPLLNLVMPTPIPSREPTPAPSSVSRSAPSEEQDQNDKVSKKDKKDKKKDKKKGKKGKDRDAQSDAPEAGVDVVIGPKGDIIQTPSTPKSVTWGENETKSYEVESPEQERKDSSEKERPRLNKASKWGILAAAIAGSSTEPANEPEPVSSDTVASREVAYDTGERSLDDLGAPPVPGPKPGSTDSKQMPGGFADDVEFAGTLAAGLEDAGFDPNIVVNDPTYRRRDSPPGSDELHESGFYKKGFSDTVEDLSKTGEPMTPGSGFVIGETEAPRDEGADEWAEVPAKLTKKEKRKQEKLAAAKRQSMDFDDAASSQPAEIKATEEFTEIPLSKKEQKKRAKAAKAKALAGDDDWETAGQGSETPTSQAQGTETPPSLEAGEDEWEASSSKKKKSKNRKSKDFSELDNDKVSVPVDAFNDIQASRETNPEDEWDAPKKKKKSKSSSVDSPSHSAPASEVGSEAGGKKKSKRRSMTGDEFNEWDGDPPDRKRVDPFEERDVSSVVSEPRYDDRRRDSKSKRSSRFDDDDDTKSVASAPGGSRKSKDSEKRSSGIFSSIFSKSNGHKDDDKKESFLDNAGTLGAGVGLAGAAAAIAAASSSRQHATEASSEIEQPRNEDSEKFREIKNTFDPEIAPRVIKPAIDPQYGDLLPLPPSEPGSPKEAPCELPQLPDSRPDTPPEERNLREHERMAHVRRRSAQELPVKSPSRTAIPIQLRLGPRSSPSTPGFLKSSPLNSPGTPDSAGPFKRSARPTSWDSSRGPIPLQLPRHVRHGSSGAVIQESDQPAIESLQDQPESAPELVESSAVVGVHPASPDQPLHLDIGEPLFVKELAGSQETTPKAEIRPEFPIVDADPFAAVKEQERTEKLTEAATGERLPEEGEPEPIDPMSKNRSSYLLNSTPSSIRSDRSIDPESLAQSPPQQLTPTKQRMLGADLSDIPEDLTSADEHFSDAREGQSEDDFFEEARSALSSELSGGSPTNTTPTRATFADPIPLEADKTTVESDQELGGTLTKKKGKKGKKKAAKATAAASSTWEATEDESMMSTPLAGPSAADRTLGTDADIPEVAVSAPDTSSSTVPEQFSDSLNDRTLGESDLQEHAVFAGDVPMGDAAFVLAPSKKDKRKKKKEKKQKQAEEPSEEPTSPSNNTGDQILEGEHADSGTPRNVVDDPKGTTAGFSQEHMPSEEPGYFPSATGLHAKKDAAVSPSYDIDSNGYYPSAARVLPIAVPAAVAAGLALKEHWDKPSNISESERDGGHADEAVGLGQGTGDKLGMFADDAQLAAIEVAKTQDRAPVDTHASEPLFSQGGETSQHSQEQYASLDSTQSNEDVPNVPMPEQDPSMSVDEPVEDEWTALVSTKKGRKNKKKKGIHAPFATPEGAETNLDDVLADKESSDPIGEPEHVQIDPAQLPAEGGAHVDSPSTAAVEAGDDDWAAATTSHKKGKKNKKKQPAALSSWDETPQEEPPVFKDIPVAADDAKPSTAFLETTVEAGPDAKEPASETALDTVVSTGDNTHPQVAEEEDEWAILTTSKKKGKKSKKKGVAAFVTWDEEPKTKGLPSQARDLGDVTEVGNISQKDATGEAPQSFATLVEPLGADSTAGPKPEAENQETQAEDEWALPKSAKTKKKDKKKMTRQPDEAIPSRLVASAGTVVQDSTEVVSEKLLAEEAVGDDEAISADKPATDESAPVVAPGVPVDSTVELQDETTQVFANVQPAEAEADEWAPIGKKDKKDKKKKKNKKLAAATWDDPATSTEDSFTLSQAPVADVAAPTVDLDTEFEVPKKGRKGKKNKNISFGDCEDNSTSVSQAASDDPSSETALLEATAGSHADLGTGFEASKQTKQSKSASAFDSRADEAIEGTNSTSVREAETGETPEALAQDLAEAEKPLDMTDSKDASEGLRLLTSSHDEAQTAADPATGINLETSASGALFAVNDLASPLKPTDFGTPLGSLQEAIDPVSTEATTSEPSPLPGEVPQDMEPSQEAQQNIEQAPQEAEESEFLFPMKKKGKKGKKGKAEPEPDAIATPVRPSAEEEVLSSTNVQSDGAEPQQQDNEESAADDTLALNRRDDVAEAADHHSDHLNASAQDSSAVDAQADGAGEQLEDEWTAPTTSKKDKKKKKLAAFELEDDQHSHDASARSLSETAPVDTTSPAADEWAPPGLSKQDKKKKKKQAALDWSQDDTPQQDNPEDSIPTAEEMQALDEAKASPVPGVVESDPGTMAAEAPATEDEWAMPALSKKDKKKKKKLAAFDWTEEEKPQEDVLADKKTDDAVPGPTIAQPEVQAEDEVTTPGLSKKDKKMKKKQTELDWIEENTTPKEINPAAGVPQPGAQTTLADAWDAPVLSKKDKKKKKKAALAWGGDETTEAAPGGTIEKAVADPTIGWEIPLTQEPSVAPESMDPSDAVNAVGIEASEAAQDSKPFLPASLDEPEPDFGFSLSKKDKKNKKKKAKAADLAWPDEQPDQPAEGASKPIEALSTEYLNSRFDQHNPHAYDEPTPWQGGLDDWSKEPPGDDPEPPREEDEDSWDVTAPKSKKTKKKKKMAADREALEESATPGSQRTPEVSSVAPVETHAPEQPTVEDDDDEWAALVTRAKGIKSDETENMSWPQPRSSGDDAHSLVEAIPGGAPDGTAGKDIVPEEIATVKDLREILSGAGTETQVPEIQDEDLIINKVADMPDVAPIFPDVVDANLDAPAAVADEPEQARDAETVLGTSGLQRNIDKHPTAAEVKDKVTGIEPTDEWITPSKLSKKDKKKKKKQQAMAWDDEPETTASAQDDQPIEPAQPQEINLEQEQAPEGRGELDKEPEAPPPAAPEPEPEPDDWAPKKLSKKDKKKAEKAARLAALEPEEPTLGASDPAPVMKEDIVPEQNEALSVQPEPEFDDWAPKKLSKKDKKKAEKASRLAALEPEQPLPEVLESAPSTEKASEPLMGDSTSLQEEPTNAGATSLQAQPEPEEWAPKLSRKDKKKAEKAARLGAFTVDDPAESSGRPAEEAPAAQPESAERILPQDPEIDEWAPQMSKKDKKKAAKAAQLAALDDPEPIPEAAMQSAQSDQPVEQDVATHADDSATHEQQPGMDEWAPKLSKKEKKKAEKAARLAGLMVDDLPLPTERTELSVPTHGEVPSIPAEESTLPETAQDVDEWAPKLSKKDKKKAAQAARPATMILEDAPVDAPANLTAAAEDVSAILSAEDDSTREVGTPVEDSTEMAPQMSKKDKKKAEKAARLAAMTQDESVMSKDSPTEEMPILTETSEPLRPTEEVQPEHDDWTPKKLSKKDKKKANKLTKTAQAMSEDASTYPTPSDPVMEDVDFKPDEPPQAVASLEAEPENDDWISNKPSKKEKKKLARAAAMTTGLAVAGGLLSQSSDKPVESTSSKSAFDAEDRLEDSNWGDAELSSDTPQPNKVETEPLSPRTSTVMDLDQAPTSYDVNKVQTSSEGMEASEPVRSSTDQEKVFTKDVSTPERGLAPESGEFPQITETHGDQAAAAKGSPKDDEWALPVKKKGKKNKKNAAVVVFPAEEPTLSEESQPAEDDTVPMRAEASSTVPEPEAVNEDPWALPVKSAKKSKKGKKKGSQEVTPSETPRSASPTRCGPESEVFGTADVADEADKDVPPAEDDLWEMPLKSGKKNKGKKKASHEPTPAETSRAPTPSPPSDMEISSGRIESQEAFAETTTPTPNQDDDWASGFSTPSSKKKKKKDRKSALLTLDPEPATETRGATEHSSWTEDASLSFEPDVPRTGGYDSVDIGAEPEALAASEPVERARTSQPNPAESTSQEQVAPEQGNPRGSSEAATPVDSHIDKLAPLDQSAAAIRSLEEDKDVKPAPQDNKSGAGVLSAAMAGAAAVGGVAAMAEKFGGGKKKKASKKKKILDKRQPREDDLFDDPALWESADKKGLDDMEVPKETEDFWHVDDTARDETENGDKTGSQGDNVPIQEQEQEKIKGTLPTPSSVSPASESGWKETARQGARLDDEFEESPILGRGEKDPLRSTDTGLLRLASDASEPESGLQREDNQLQSLTAETKSGSPEFKRSPSRGLPVVQEVPETETETSRELWPSPEINRDSGFVTDSPHPLNRHSKTFEELHDEPQRDSGIHTEDWDESAPHTPGNRWEHKLRRSPQSTPRLQEPIEPAATPEPEKRRLKNYGSVADEATSSRGISGPGAATAAALAAGAVAASTSAGRDTDPRSFSEGHARTLWEQGASPSPSLSSQHAGSSLRRTASNTSIVRQRTPEPLKFRPESPGIRSTPTPPLRRVNRRISTELPPAPASRETNTPKPVANETKVRVRDKDKDMTDVYDGFGEGRIGSPRSPTRPHSMRRRQSMQVLELESKVEQLLAENRLLSDARNHAEQNLSQRATSVLSERDAEIENLKQSLQFLQNEVSRLTEVNDGLTSANAELASKDNSRYAGLEASSGDGSRGLDLAAGGAAGAAAGSAATAASYQQSIQEKDDEIADLRAQLEDAKEQVREMQRQILASKAGEADFLDILDEDHFDHRCQQLCSHVQQWVLRFSKFSDMRACRLTSEINDEKTIDRLDNAVLDGSDVDVYLKDRVRRRDIFMSMTMNMIWEFVFTRYLFGMDREQRQKLKSLEKLLTEVGPAQAVRQWRAVTLTLLSRRHSFKEQRDLDTEAVVQAIFQTLCKILPPPSNLEDQIQSQLRRVMAEAVALSIQMRTQKAEYMMLPPLQPEYDADGELAASVYFNASMMNERSGNSTVSNEELEAQQAKVRIVLFPLVVKKGDDTGIGDEEIVVCPAQVVVASRHSRRSIAPSSDAGGASLGGAPSRVSVVTEHMT